MIEKAYLAAAGGKVKPILIETKSDGSKVITMIEDDEKNKNS